MVCVREGIDGVHCTLLVCVRVCACVCVRVHVHVRVHVGVRGCLQYLIVCQYCNSIGPARKTECAVVCMLHVWTRVRPCSLLYRVVWEVYEVQERAV